MNSARRIPAEEIHRAGECVTNELQVPANADFVEAMWTQKERCAMRDRSGITGYLRCPSRIRCFYITAITPARCRVSGDHRGSASDGGFLHRGRVGEALPRRSSG